MSNIANNNLQQPTSVEEDEIDLIALAKKVWDGRKTIIKITLIFMAIGLFVALFSPKEFTTTTTMVPQTSSGKQIGGNLGGLAAMAGINLGSMGGDAGIAPTLYPQIVNSIPFQKELLQTPLTFEGQKNKVTYADYFTNIHRPGVLGTLKKYTIGLPGVIIKAIKGKSENQFPSNENQLLSVTNDEYELIKQLQDQVALDVHLKDGYVTLSANMPEAIASAELAKKAQNLLQQYIIDYKVQKSTEQLKFIQGRFNEKQQEFKAKQQELARFRDRNQFMNSALAQTSFEIIQSEYNVSEKVYSELAKQLETQKIQVKEDTPVFAVLNPVAVPIKKSKPNRPITLVIFTFLGVVVGVGTVFGREFLGSVKEQWNGSEK